MQKKHKIIHIITRLDKGGSAENTLLTVLGMDKKKYEVLLVKGSAYESKMSREEHTLVANDLIEAKSKGVKIINSCFLLRRINIIYDLLALFTLWVFLIKEKPAIVHTHTSKAGLLGRLAAKLAGIPIIIHTPHGHVFFGYFGFLTTKIFIFLEKLASRITDKIVTLTSRERDDHIVFRIADEGKFVVVNSGVELNKFKELSINDRQKFKKKLGIPLNYFVVGTVGRLVPVKGTEYLIRAAKHVISEYPNTFFVFTGDGHLKKELRKKALELGIKNNVMFLGWRGDIAKIISVYDVFVLPSLNEGMGRALVEAMALGKPIVASDVGGIPDLVKHGKNGFLVLPKNPDDLAKYIQVLLGKEEIRKEMGQIGKEMALDFSREIMVEKISKLYEDLLAIKDISL
jgi:glycosyltransferase involved in cell wall biosynthesis